MKTLAMLALAAFLLVAATTADPGEESSLVLDGGMLNDQDVSAGPITAAPGEEISGEVTVSWDSAWNPDYGTPLVSTPSWGIHSLSYTARGHARGKGSKSISISETVPAEPGTYHLLFAYRAEISHDEVASLTNWARDEGVVWDDGNDIASFSQQQIEDANADGNVQAQVLFQEGYQQVSVPAASITILVEDTSGDADGGETNGNQSSGNDTGTGSSDQACYESIGELPVKCEDSQKESDSTSGSCRTVVCSGDSGRLKVMACDKSSGGEDYFEMYNQDHTDKAIDLCIGGTCLEGWGYKRSDQNYPICVDDGAGEDGGTDDSDPGGNQTGDNGSPAPPEDDKGKQASIYIQDGMINGQEVTETSYKADRTISVQPGQPIEGWVELDGHHEWDNLTTPLIGTPTWGDHASSFIHYGNASHNVIADVDWAAPPTPGTYYIVFAFRAELDGGDVASMTNWAADPEVWDDGNDVAGWSEDMIADAMADRKVVADVLFNSGMRKRWVPANAVQVNVVEGENAIVTLDQEFSVDHNVVVECSTGFQADAYEWTFGDGKTYLKDRSNLYCSNSTHWSEEECDQIYENLKNSSSWNKYHHTYQDDGNYEIICTAHGDGIQATGSATTDVFSPATPEQIPNPPDEPTAYDPYVFQPVEEHIDGSTYRIGGYSLGLPHEEDGEGQYGYWAFTTGFYSHLTATHPSIITITFPEPGEYDMYPNAGGHFWEQDPAELRWGSGLRGCSNPRTICFGSYGSLNVTVPDLGTRDEFGILARQVRPFTYNISCQSYASDAGSESRLNIQDPNNRSWHDLEGNEWVQHEFQEQGSYEIECWQSVGYGLDKRYETVLNVTDEVDDPGNVSAEIVMLPQSADHNLIVGCQADMNATSFNWDLGDGSTASKSASQYDSLWHERGHLYHHTYTEPGTYTITCHASNEMQTATAEKTVTITTPATQSQIEEHYLVPTIQQSAEGRDITYTCLATGLPPDGQEAGIGVWNETWSHNRPQPNSPPAPGPTTQTIQFPGSGSYNGTCQVGVDSNEYSKAYYNDHDTTSCEYPPGRGICTSAWIDFTTIVQGQEEQVCASTVSELRVECSEGSVTEDTSSGSCRFVRCASSGGHLRVQACDKGNSFEMYEKSREGDWPDLCLGNTCMGSWGWRQGGEYPVCTEGEADGDTGDGSSGGGNQSQDGQDGSDGSTETSVSLRVKEWYPQGRDYVFVCEESGYDASGYAWDFGDGNDQKTDADNVYHTYADSGDYEVVCTASDGVSESDTLQIQVG